METRKHTFMDVFGESFMDDNGNPVELRRIVIPIIQRDYAQGRAGKETERVRRRFLDSLFQALVGDGTTLDFVYGDVDENGNMTPLDGQQRLTTLFLLHWFAAKRERVTPDESRFLGNFTYETRYSARDFCRLLVEFEPDFDSVPTVGSGESHKGWLSGEIEDQHWFPLDWKRDPTVASMLVMLDAIHDRFDSLCNPGDGAGLWDRLKAGKIGFYFLPIKDMGLTDELYIKMNSRGKPLTMFEHFKAELERNLKKTAELQGMDLEFVREVSRKIDVEWSDLLWEYRGDDNVTDDEFLRYFNYVCDVITYKEGATPQGKSNDPFDLLDRHFAIGGDGTIANAGTLAEYFDCWRGDKVPDGPAALMESLASNEHEPGKVRIDGDINVFSDCLRNFGEYQDASRRNRRFPLRKTVLLYAVTTYLQSEGVTEEQFRRRLRIVWNLVQNSPDQIRDSGAREDSNRMPAILGQVDSIVRDGVIVAPGEAERGEGLGPNFNPDQLREEIEKLAWTQNHPELAESLYELEDHDLLYGQISIVGLDNPEYFNRFASLFACDWSLVSRALLATGGYGRCHRGWRWQLGSGRIRGAWENLFHRGRESGFDNTKQTLGQLLSKAERFSDGVLVDIVGAYVSECEENRIYDWRYYFVKPGNENAFFIDRYGKYLWRDRGGRPYEIRALWTDQAVSENAVQPFVLAGIKGVVGWRMDRDANGESAVNEELGLRLFCENGAFVFKSIASGEVVRTVPVEQVEGVDAEDRVQKIRADLLSLQP